MRFRIDFDLVIVFPIKITKAEFEFVGVGLQLDEVDGPRLHRFIK